MLTWSGEVHKLERKSIIPIITIDFGQYASNSLDSNKKKSSEHNKGLYVYVSLFIVLHLLLFSLGQTLYFLLSSMKRSATFCLSPVFRRVNENYTEPSIVCVPQIMLETEWLPQFGSDKKNSEKEVTLFFRRIGFETNQCSVVRDKF